MTAGDSRVKYARIKEKGRDLDHFLTTFSYSLCLSLSLLCRALNLVSLNRYHPQLMQPRLLHMGGMARQQEVISDTKEALLLSRT